MPTQQQQQQQPQDYYLDVNLRHQQKSMSPTVYNESFDSRTGLNESTVHDNIIFSIIRISGKLRSIFIKDNLLSLSFFLLQ
jgi:hypothetical protein